MEWGNEDRGVRKGDRGEDIKGRCAVKEGRGSGYEEGKGGKERENGSRKEGKNGGKEERVLKER